MHHYVRAVITFGRVAAAAVMHKDYELMIVSPGV